MFEIEEEKSHNVVQVRAVALDGVTARTVQVEASTFGEGLGIDVIGLPDTAVRESRMRIARAARRFGVVDTKKTLINLAPATLKKEGTALDLAMAVAYVASHTKQPIKLAQEFVVAGEISLAGEATGLKAALPMAIHARRLEARGLVVPNSALPEVSIVEGLPIYGVADVGEALAVLGGFIVKPTTIGKTPPVSIDAKNHTELAQVKGQELAKRALTIAAIGGHNVLMMGPPGSGKTMLARALPGILPPLELAHALQCASIHASVGRPRAYALYVPPFRAPHHTASRQALVGGGAHPRPGEVTLAHRGVLFLDELPEFGRDALEVLRQPLEDHEVTISRSRTYRTFPADFMLIAAMNPCPCGYYGDKKKPCTCTITAVQRYRQRISGPLLDRFDMHLPVRRVNAQELLTEKSGQDSATLRQAVLKAREVSRGRNGMGKMWRNNARLDANALERLCQLGKKRRKMLAEKMEQLQFSGRAFVRILRVARSIADLEQERDVSDAHLLEAMQFRGLDRPTR